MLEVENQTPAPFRLQVLGGAWLESGTTSPVTLERKVAALLTLLALEGPTTRSRMAGLLWADRLEDVARSNLRQCLRRLRNLTGTELVGADDTLRLVPDLRVDALRLESLVFTGEYAPALELEGVLLAGLEYDDCPEFEEWLHSTRDRLENARREALSAEADRLEHEGNLVAALGLASRLLERDPLSEGAHRRVMRLHYLQGDRSSALAAFDRCCKTLNSKLDLEPSPETLDLAGLIERGSNLAQMVLPTRTSIPLSILRPPVLVGRAREWALLEAAWEARKVVFLVGDAGIGKSRLMLDFVATKGAFMPHNGRPGDAQIPYSTFSRGLRTIVGTGDQPTKLPPPWICRELLRLVPEKAVRFGMELPAAIGSRDELLRFFDAITEFTRLSPHQWVAFVSDDLQFYDTASFELGMYISGRLTDAEGQLIRNLVAYRRGALSPAIQALVEQMLASDQAVLIDLEALEPPAIQSFLTELALPGLERFSPAISRYTGGNPMFMLETLKHLIEKGTLEQDFPEHLPPPGRIGALVRQRLELLSAAALRLVRVAAIAGTDFSLELGAKVLETNWVDLTEPLVELEQAQVMKAEKFSHDLIFEAVQDGIPHGTKILVHSRIAAFLEHQGSNPSRVARHWLEALEYDRAAPVMIVAAEIAQDMGRDEEAIELLERTIALPVAVEHRHRAQALLGGIHVHAQRYDDAQYDLESLLEVVNDPKAHWLTLDHLCYLHLSKGSLERAQHFGLRALELAKLHGVLSQLEDTQYKLGAIAFGVGEYERALELITPVIKSWREQPVGIRYLNALGAFAQSLQHLGRDTQASLYIDEMLRHANAIGADAVIVNHTSNALYDAFVRGDATSAIHDAENLLRNLEQQASGVKVDMLRNNLAAIYTRLERPDDAIRQYRLLTGNESESVEYRCRAWANLAVLYHQQSNPEFSKRALNRALELAPDDDFPSTRFAVIRAAYTLGTSQQRATVQPYMDALNLDALPVSYRNELEELLAARKHSLDTNTT